MLTGGELQLWSSHGRVEHEETSLRQRVQCLCKISGDGWKKNRSMSITCGSETTELRANNRPACETWAQILVRSLFFEFLGLARITKSNLGASSSGEFPGLNEMGVFPNKQDFKGRQLARKVRLSANMYSFSNIYFLPPALFKASLLLGSKD